MYYDLHYLPVMYVMIDLIYNIYHVIVFVLRFYMICNVFIGLIFTNLVRFRAELTIISALKCLNISDLTLEFRASHWQDERSRVALYCTAL